VKYPCPKFLSIGKQILRHHINSSALINPPIINKQATCVFTARDRRYKNHRRVLHQTFDCICGLENLSPEMLDDVIITDDVTKSASVSPADDPIDSSQQQESVDASLGYIHT